MQKTPLLTPESPLVGIALFKWRLVEQNAAKKQSLRQELIQAQNDLTWALDEQAKLEAKSAIARTQSKLEEETRRTESLTKSAIESSIASVSPVWSLRLGGIFQVTPKGGDSSQIALEYFRPYVPIKAKAKEPALSYLIQGTGESGGKIVKMVDPNKDSITDINSKVISFESFNRHRHVAAVPSHG